MGQMDNTTVQLVISHVEGSSGNFLGRLYVDATPNNTSMFRVDTDYHNDVLSINGKANLEQELKRLTTHRVVVTHNSNLELLANYFPHAQIIQIYPYTRLGNVVYNISYKKLKTTMSNLVDNHYIHITEWVDQIKSNRPKNICADFGLLHDQSQCEKLLQIKLTKSQQTFFQKYWEQQLAYDLSWPTGPESIQQLITRWKITEWCSPWSIAWTIFVFERTHGLTENQRQWSIAVENFTSWQDLINIQYRYAT